MADPSITDLEKNVQDLVKRRQLLEEILAAPGLRQHRAETTNVLAKAEENLKGVIVLMKSTMTVGVLGKLLASK